MRRSIILVLVLSLLSMNLGSVEAANSQGFEWGVDVGDRIDYTISYYQPSVTTDPEGEYDAYATVVSLPAIPESVTTFSEINQGAPAVEYYYTNGTQIFMVSWSIVAIGNWSLATELFEAQMSAWGNVTETETDWIMKQILSYSGDNVLTHDLRHSKTDGVMNYYYSAITNPEEEVISSLSIVRSGYNPSTSSGTTIGEIDPILLLSLGAVGAFIVIVAVIIIRKR